MIVDGEKRVFESVLRNSSSRYLLSDESSATVVRY